VCTTTTYSGIIHACVSKPQVHISVSEEKKERWKEYAEKNPQHDNLSQLIRFAVEQEIYDAEGELNTERLEDTQQEILSEIEELDRSVRALDNSVVTTEEFNEFENSFEMVLDTLLDRYITGLVNDNLHYIEEIYKDVHKIKEKLKIGK